MADSETAIGCPAHIPVNRLRHFDYARDPLKAETPFDAYLEFRGAEPFYSTAAGGFWVLTSAEVIRDMFQDPATFSNAITGIDYGKAPRRQIPENLDPPEHGKYRRLIAPWFTPTAANELEEAIREVASNEVASLVAEGRCDFVRQFAGRVPQIVFLRYILHLPVEDLETFLKWEHDILRQPVVPETKAESGRAVTEYLTALVRERAVNPIENDLISSLLRETVDERPLTEDEVVDMAYLLFAAGLDTVTTAMSHAVNYLARHPEERRDLIANPEKMPTAIEEFLRFYSFVSPARTVTKDTDFHGVPLKRGDRILPASVLAAHDPAEFDDPDQLILDRSPNRHMAFGAGPHRCAGSHLARFELGISLAEFHKKIPDYEIDTEQPITYHAAGMVGLDALPLRWSAA